MSLLCVRALRRLAPLAAVLAAASCELLADVELTPVAETNSELCSDERDNDFDGLTDCQDWNCLGVAVCCNIPEVIITDDFENGPADCEAATCADTTCAELSCGPDAEVWHSWPCPYPKVCGGALHLDKTTCFAAGLVSRAAVSLEPGLKVDVDLIGRPEQMGYLEIALTQQDEAELAGSYDPCGSDQRVTGFASLREVQSEGGYLLSARLHDSEVGASATVTDTESPHRATLGIDFDRRITYALDGEVFATAPIPVPSTGETTRVALSGLTAAVSVAAVRVQVGLRCPDPTSWSTAGADIESSVALAGDLESGLVFDRDEVFHPSVRQTGGGIELYYTGCWWPSNSTDCEPWQLGIGRATSVDDGEYQRDGYPWLTPEGIPAVGLAGIHRQMSVDVLADSPLRGYVAPASYVGVFGLDEALQPTVEALPPGLPGEWDAGEICCATALEHPDGTTYLWYSGQRHIGGGDWRIGLATSADGVTFTRHSENPVLLPGPLDAFDSIAVTSPVVVYDAERALFRMWYEGVDFFLDANIGYAVSTDGLTWHKWPNNPVFSLEGLGLTSAGGPEVLLGEDGRLRAWVHGTTPDVRRRRIFAFTNEGTLVAP